jgi:hypothetical protein
MRKPLNERGFGDSAVLRCNSQIELTVLLVNLIARWRFLNLFVCPGKDLKVTVPLFRVRNNEVNVLRVIASKSGNIQ